MHPNTIKKYWRLLEENKLIKYEGPVSDAARLKENIWLQEFKERKKNKSSYYSIPKPPQNDYRIIPEETIDKMQNHLLISELELKMYLLLGNMQEHFCYKNSFDTKFSIADLRDMLKLSKNESNNKSIALGLIWLSKIGLVEYKPVAVKNNFGQTYYVFELISVNYYSNNKEIEAYIDNNQSYLSEEMKEAIVNENLLNIDFIV